MQQGLEQYPKSCLLYLAYTNFCFAFLGKNERMPYVYLDRLRHLEPPFDIRFYIYKKDAELKQRQESNSLGSELSLDLVSYIEFQNNYKNARRFHHKALRAIRSFWRLLLQDHVNLMELPKAFRQIDNAESKAIQHYTQLLNRYPKSVRILRGYAQFQEEVLNDPQLADHYYLAADMLEDENSRQRAQNEQQDSDSQSEGEMQYITAHTRVDSNDFMIMIDKCGIIKDVNRNCKLFGYSTSDLLEKRVTTVIPEPFKKDHDQFLYNYLSTGRTKIIGMGGRQLPFLQKDGSLSSILLSVTKVAIGNDFLFVGLVKKMKEGIIGVDKDGSIVYATQPFTQATEWENKRLAENNLSLLIPHTDVNRQSQLFQFLEQGRVIARAGEGNIEVLDANGQTKLFHCSLSANLVKGDWLYTLLLSPVLEGTPSKFEIDSASNSDVQSQAFSQEGEETREVRAERRSLRKKAGNHFSRKFRRFAETHQKLSHWNLWGIIVLAVLAVVSYIATMILLNQLNAHNGLVKEFGTRTKLSQEICIETRGLTVADTESAFEKTRKDLATDGNNFHKMHSQLFGKEKYDDSISVELYVDQNETATLQTNLLDLGNSLFQTVEILTGAINMTNFSENYVNDIFFIIQNCGTFLTSFDTAMWTKKNETDSSWTSLLVLHCVIFGLAWLILIGLAIHVLKITFSKIHNERNSTLGLFLNIPREAVSELAQRGRPYDGLDEAKAPSQNGSFSEFELHKLSHQDTVQFEVTHVEDISDTVCSVKIEEPRKPIPILKNHSLLPAITSPLSTARDSPVHASFFQRSYLQSPLLRKLASQYLMALLLIAILFFPPIYVTHAFGDVKQTRQTEIALASRRQSLALYTVWLMDELTVSGSNTSWILLQQSTQQLKEVHSSLVFGSNRYGISGYDSWTSKQRRLMFEECLLENQKECEHPSQDETWATHGLNTLFVHFVETINLFAEQPDYWNDPTSSEYFLWIKNNTSILNKALGRSTDYYQQQADGIFRAYNIIYTVLFFLSLILFVVIHVFGFKTITRILINESKRTRSMLLMIPAHVVDNSEELQAYLSATQDKESDEF